MNILSEALAAPRKTANDPQGGREPQVENHWLRRSLGSKFFQTFLFALQPSNCQCKFNDRKY